MKYIEQLLSGFGTIPTGWKSGIYGFLVALVVMLNEFGVPVPDWVDENWMLKTAATIAIALSLLLKKLRASRS